MKRAAIAVALWAIASSVAAAPNVEQMKRDVSGSLRDPSSAQYRDLTVIPETPGKTGKLCGWLNARNGFGGYTGFRAFYAVIINGRASLIHVAGDMPLDDSFTMLNCGIHLAD